MARKNSKKAINIYEIFYEYRIEKDSFYDVIVGTSVASFSFDCNTKDGNIENSNDLIILAATVPVNRRGLQTN